MPLANAAVAPQLESEPFFDRSATSAAAGTADGNVELLTPSRSGDDTLNAIAARRAGRLNAASIKESEVEKMLQERQALISRKFTAGLSRTEERRLALLRWNLDRIQDAKHGETLDALEAAVAMYEDIGSQIQQLMADLARYAPSGRRR